MRILYVHDNCYHVGGAETYLFSLMELVKESGHETYFFSTDKVKEEKNNSVYIYREPNKNRISSHISHYYFDFGVYNALRKWLKKVTPDIMHLNLNWKYPVSIILAARSEKIPVVQTIHDIRVVCISGLCVKPDGEVCEGGFGTKCLKNGCISFKGYLYNALPDKIKRYLMKDTLFIAPSRAFERKLKENGMKNVVYLPHFIDSPKYEFNMDIIEKGNVLYVGLLYYTKGIQYLIQAFPEILKHIPWARLHLVGEGPDRSKLERLAEELGIEKEVVFNGKIPRSKMFEYYQKANVVILPSICMENSPYVIHEAMASGRPVIGSNIGGIPELVEDWKTGFLVEPGNPNQIAEKVIQILSDEKLLREMAVNARKRVEEKLKVENHVNNILRIYKSLS